MVCEFLCLQYLDEIAQKFYGVRKQQGGFLGNLMQVKLCEMGKSLKEPSGLGTLSWYHELCYILLPMWVIACLHAYTQSACASRLALVLFLVLSRCSRPPTADAGNMPQLGL